MVKINYQKSRLTGKQISFTHKDNNALWMMHALENSLTKIVLVELIKIWDENRVLFFPMRVNIKKLKDWIYINFCCLCDLVTRWLQRVSSPSKSSQCLQNENRLFKPVSLFRFRSFFTYYCIFLFSKKSNGRTLIVDHNSELPRLLSHFVYTRPLIPTFIRT